MFPTLYEVHTALGAVGVHTYGLFILAAFSSAFLLAHYRALQIGLHPDRLLGVYVSAAVGGMLGGRLLYAFAVEPARTFSDPLSLFSFAGFAVYGGVIGGAIGVGLLARLTGIPTWKLADLAAPAVFIGMGVGRLGCFFAGCCHGGLAPISEDPVGLVPDGTLHGQIWLSKVFPFLTLEFHDGVGRLHDVPLYPTQLWAAVGLTGLCLLLNALWRYRRFDGQLAGIALLLEPPVRILIEAFRADDRGYAFQWPVSEAVAAWFPGMVQAGADVTGGGMMGLTTSQAIGLLAMLFGAFILISRRNAGVQPEVPIDEDEEIEEDDVG